MRIDDYLTDVLDENFVTVDGLDSNIRNKVTLDREEEKKTENNHEDLIDDECAMNTMGFIAPFTLRDSIADNRAVRILMMKRIEEEKKESKKRKKDVEKN